MNILTAAQRLKSLRLTLGLTQFEAGQLAGLPQPMVSRIESGNLIDPIYIERLESALLTRAPGGSLTVPQPGRAEGAPTVKRAELTTLFGEGRVRWQPLPPKIPLDVRLNQARLTFGNEWVQGLIRHVQSVPGAEVQTSILATLNLDSSYECVYLTRLITEGWRFGQAAPLNLGVRWLIRDRHTGQYIGDVSRWILYYPGPECHIALIPQVTVMAESPSRLDFPGIVVRDNTRSDLLVEVDGGQHLTEAQRVLDQDRTLRVNLPTLRFGVEDLRSRPSLTRELIVFAAPLCHARPSMTRKWA